MIIIFENNKIGTTARLMTITKVKRTDDDKRKAANAANRRSRLKRRLQPEPIIVVIQNGEIQKKPPGRPIKYLTGQSRDNANRIAWANSKRLKRQRAKEEEKNTVDKTTEKYTKSKIVPLMIQIYRRIIMQY